mmetsp:Transcript_22070/g.49379  ORF Transcript_22070/g.49379 Transcript_22070/m.49379 type:complete len:201 (+) Transcript_22070:690-1292(+)
MPLTKPADAVESGAAAGLPENCSCTASECWLTSAWPNTLTSGLFFRSTLWCVRPFFCTAHTESSMTETQSSRTFCLTRSISCLNCSSSSSSSSSYCAGGAGSSVAAAVSFRRRSKSSWLPEGSIPFCRHITRSWIVCRSGIAGAAAAGAGAGAVTGARTNAPSFCCIAVRCCTDMMLETRDSVSVSRSSITPMVLVSRSS